MIVKRPSFLVVLFLFITLLSPAVTEARDPAATAKSIRSDATITVEKTFRLPTDTPTLHFLLNHLDVTCAIIRGWNLESFHATQTGPGKYRARDGAGLMGTITVLTSGDTDHEYLGEGRYEGNRLPVTLPGRAVAAVQLSPDGTQQTRVTGKLHVRINNTVIHWMVKGLYPLIGSLAEDKTEHLIKIEKKTIKKISRSPHVTTQRLREIDTAYSRDWEKHLNSRSN
jgi:hypothetical protein